MRSWQNCSRAFSILRAASKEAALPKDTILPATHRHRDKELNAVQVVCKVVYALL